MKTDTKSVFTSQNPEIKANKTKCKKKYWYFNQCNRGCKVCSLAILADFHNVSGRNKQTFIKWLMLSSFWTYKQNSSTRVTLWNPRSSLLFLKHCWDVVEDFHVSWWFAQIYKVSFRYQSELVYKADKQNKAYYVPLLTYAGQSHAKLPYNGRVQGCLQVFNVIFQRRPNAERKNAEKK